VLLLLLLLCIRLSGACRCWLLSWPAYAHTQPWKLRLHRSCRQSVAKTSSDEASHVVHASVEKCVLRKGRRNSRSRLHVGVGTHTPQLTHLVAHSAGRWRRTEGPRREKRRERWSVSRWGGRQTGGGENISPIKLEKKKKHVKIRSRHIYDARSTNLPLIQPIQ